MRSSRGFTLMELLVVLAIISVLATVVLVRLTAGTEKAKVSAAKETEAAIVQACQAFYSDIGYWPTNIDWNTGADSGLIKKENLSKVRNEKGKEIDATDDMKTKWKGPYLEAHSWPKDPWGNKYFGISSGGNPTQIIVYCGDSDGWSTPQAKWQAGEPPVGNETYKLVHIYQKD